MIKIEITDPQREAPAALVKIATFLLELAGHGVAQVSEENFNKRMKKAYVMSIDDLPGVHGHGECSAPYQHCAESNLTTANLGDVPGQESIVREVNSLPEHSHCNTVILEDSQGNQFEVRGVTDLKDLEMRIGTEDIEKDHYKNATQELVDQVLPPPVVASKHIDEPIVAEKPKRKRTPSKPKFEVIKETGVTEVSEDLIPMPPIETIAPPPPVNGNTVMDKILNALNDQKLTRDEITAIVVKHGLKATRDIFTNDHLIPAIDADIDEALRGK